MNFHTTIFYGTTEIVKEEIKVTKNGNEVTVTPIDYRKIGLNNEGTTNLDIAPIDSK